ncbi:protein disulfide oxidoreductase [Shewanella sp. OPT22]|nr:protein disulfide oxidoreductase [Shewanella sp. OPT22]
MNKITNWFFKISWKKSFRDLAIFIVLLTAVSLFIQRNMASGQAPQINAISITGKSISLKSPSAKPTLIYFWGTWCGYCRFTSPMVEKISQDYPVISIALSSGTNDEINEYLKEHDLTFNALNDGNGYYSHQWGVSGVPSIFIIDTEGKIAATTQGPTTSWGLRFRLWLASF